MNARSLLENAKKMADYEQSHVSILSDGLNEQLKIMFSLRGEENEQCATVLRTIADFMKKYPTPARIAVSVAAFEIQIEEARERAIERNN